MQRRSLFASSFLAAFGASASAKAADLPTLPASVTDEVIPSADKPVLLNFNENSLGMCAKAKQAVVDGLATACRYPDDAREAAQKAIAAKFGVAFESVTLGAGSSEIIQAAIQSQVEKARHAGKKVQLVEPVPTFGIAAAYAEASHVPVKDINLAPGSLKADIPAMKKAVAEFDGVSVIYFCNPNNPTSVVSPASEINAWIEEAAAAKAPVFFILDEAYADYITDPAFVSGIELVKKGLTNVTVARTFSKLYALAGLRLGFAVSVPATTGEIADFCSIDNINYAAAVAASASMADTAFAKLSLESTALSRAIVTKAFDELGIEYLPSQANFIFHKTKGAAGEYKKAMTERHIIVGREFPPITGWNRLTLGTPGEMKAFVKALKEVHKAGLV